MEGKNIEILFHVINQEEQSKLKIQKMK